jgi:hypothetical protein
MTFSRHNLFYLICIWRESLTRVFISGYFVKFSGKIFVCIWLNKTLPGVTRRITCCFRYYGVIVNYIIITQQSGTRQCQWQRRVKTLHSHRRSDKKEHTNVLNSGVSLSSSCDSCDNSYVKDTSQLAYERNNPTNIIQKEQLKACKFHTWTCRWGRGAGPPPHKD